MEYQSSYPGPLGFLILKSDGQSITEILFSGNDIQEQNTCNVLEKCKDQLANYFSGKIFHFNIPLHPNGTEFQQKVWSELQKIPYGETITYMELKHSIQKNLLF